MDKESNKRRSTENLLTGWMGGDKKRKTNEPSSPLSTSAIATETETITRSMEKVQISPAKSSPNVDKVRAKLDFSATLPPSASPYWSIVKQHSKKACLAEMRRAGLDEMAEWNTKAFLDKNPPGYTYLWFKKSDWEAINALDTIEAKIEMMFATVLYVGIDADFDRFPGHLSPYHFATPFDRFLKTALANGEKFVAVYFGTKNKMNLAFECVMIAKVKWAKLQFFKVHQSATKLFNIHQSSPDKFVTGFNSNQFISVLVCLFEMALKSPVRIFESKEHHQQKVKDYFAKMQILQNNRFELFIEELMNSLVKANGQLKCDKLLGFTDTEFECFLGKMLKCKIVKQEKNGKLVPYITKVGLAAVDEASDDDVFADSENSNNNKSGGAKEQSNDGFRLDSSANLFDSLEDDITNRATPANSNDGDDDDVGSIVKSEGAKNKLKKLYGSENDDGHDQGDDDDDSS